MLRILIRVAPDLDLKLALSEKLKILRRLDQFRRWDSLEEKRYCLGCDQTIRGEEIRVLGDLDDPESLRVVCPTEHCPSIPMDWARLSAETNRSVSHQAGKKLSASVTTPPAAAVRGRIRGPLRKLANQWFRPG